MKRVTVATLATLGAITSLALPASAAAANWNVDVGSYYYRDPSPSDGRVVVNKGDHITFRFEGDTQHTATVDGQFSSGVRSPGDTYVTSALTRAGTFTLYCEVHGASRHSTVLVVRETSAPSPSPSPRASPSRSPAPRPSKSPAARPSPRASHSPAASPHPTAASPSASPTGSPTASPVASASASAAPKASASPSASPTKTATAPSGATSPEGHAVDVAPAAPLDDGGGWVLPTAVVLIAAGLGTVAIALGKRRRV
jgi:plastocyanin